MDNKTYHLYTDEEKLEIIKAIKKTIYLLELVQLNTILLKLLWLCDLDPIEKMK